MDSLYRVALANSADIPTDSRALRYAFDDQNIQLIQCQEELNNTKNQLQCLIHFVRRAWSGDVEASIHVANIVGVAPPDLCLQGDTNKIVATPKSAAINNWAILTQGLLKQEESKNADEWRIKQHEYLLERDGIFDKQLSRLKQQPQMRTRKDASGFINCKMHRDDKRKEGLVEKLFVCMQPELQEIKGKVSKKQKVSRHNTYSGRFKVGAPRMNFDDEKQKWFGLYIDASQSQLTPRETATKKAWQERTAPARKKGPGISTHRATSCVPKMTKFSHSKLSNSIESNNLKVPVRIEVPRAFSAKEIECITKDDTTKTNYRRHSIGNSFPREVYKSDEAMKYFKGVIPDLETKLNINPEGQMNF